MPKKKGELSIEERLEQSIVAKEEMPYKLPSNWVWTRLGDITESFDKKRKPVSLDERNKIKNPKIYPYYGATGIIDYIDEYIFDGKYILLGEDGANLLSRSKENAFIACGKFWVNNHAHILKNKSAIIDKFFVYFYNNLDLKEYVTGSAQPKLNAVNLSKIKFILPPLEEQKRIVEKLDSLFEKIQKIKEIIEEVKEKTTSRREAILSKAFSGELTEKWRGENHSENARELLVKINDEKLKLWEDECKKAEDEGRKKPAKPKLKTIDEMLVGAEEEPYKLPNNWIWTRLGDITNVVSGGTPSTSKEEYYNGNIPWITPKDLSNYKEKYILNGARNITEEGLKKSSAVLLPINSVLMSSRAPIGYVVINKKEVSTNQGFKSFTPSISYIPEYLYHYLKKSKNYLESIATGTTFKELSGDKAKKIIFPLPPLEEQKEIVRVLDKVFEEENRISELISLENKIEILEKTILDRAFRGELDTGNNDDEPAIELLRRCLEGKR